MAVQGIILILGVVFIHFILMMITLCISCNTEAACKNRASRLLSFVVQTVCCCAMNFIIFLFVHYAVFHNWGFQTLYKIKMFQMNYNDFGRFAIYFLICTLFSILSGYVLRFVPARITGRNNRYYMNSVMHEKPILILLLSAMAIIIVFCISVQSTGRYQIVINEIASNTADNNRNDYVELYNTGNLSYEISELYLSDDINQLHKMKLSDEIIEPQGFLLIQLDENSIFGLSNSGEAVYLSDQNGKIIDQVEFTSLSKDISYCRFPDGGNDWRAGICSPGKSNDVSDTSPRQPSFSRESGFYSDEFDLIITSEYGMKIYYTLDGSIPSEESFLYDAPIHIHDTSENANTWSMRDDVSTAFLVLDSAEQGIPVPFYQVPDSPIDKCTVIRAVCINENGAKSAVSSASYFVSFEEKAGYDGMNVVSVITDPDNFFGYENGIYVRGKKYDEYLASDTENWYDPYWWFWDANYTQKGRDWEREVFLQFFNKNGALILSKDAGIRIQGGGSRGRVPKSFNLYARKDYDNDSRFRVNLFGNPYEPQRVTLFAGGDDNGVKSRDYLMAYLCSNRNFATMKFEPYVMFLNGEYWGFYWLTEKYDGEYFQYHYDVDHNDVIMVKNGVIAEGDESDLALYTEMCAFIANEDMSMEANYEKACELIDINSFIDYYAAEIYIARNNDWPIGNFALWRTREAGDGLYNDGKWRWILFDVNSGGLASALAEADILSYTISLDPVFASLIKNDGFYQLFKDTILDMANNEFLPQNIETFYNNYRELMEEPLKKEYSRFYGSENQMLVYFDSDIEDIITFFDRRYDYITSCFDSQQ